MSSREITISDGIDSVTLLSDIEFKLSGEEVSQTATMASSKIVKDVIGYRDVLEIPVGYLSLENMSKLRNMIRKNNGFLSISYPTTDGDRTEMFVINDPACKAVKYNDEGVAVWIDVTINAKSAEVIDPW